jgi:Alpha/beta hydrolase family
MMRIGGNVLPCPRRLARRLGLDLVRAELESRGHVVHAPDLPCEDVHAGLDEYAALVPPCDVVVGHSLGGYTIPGVERCASTSAGSCPGAQSESAPGFGAARRRDELGRSYFPDWHDAARELQYPDAYARLAQLLRRQAPIDDPGGGVTRGVYVVCTHDARVSPSWQRDLASRFRRLDLETGHSPMLTHPPELADVLLGVQL